MSPDDGAGASGVMSTPTVREYIDVEHAPTRRTANLTAMAAVVGALPCEALATVATIAPSAWRYAGDWATLCIGEQARREALG